MKLYYQTVSPILLKYLERLMKHPAFKDFYLVGGTSLSLQRGHRMSIDIDLFTCVPYGEMNTVEIKSTLEDLFPYTDRTEELQNRQMVYSMYVGESDSECIKLDLCYDDPPIFPLIETNGMRIISEKDIAAMKLQAIANNGQRRKDFWDIHDLLETYTLSEMINWGLKRYPWSITKEEIITSFENLPNITDKTEVICLKSKYWEFIVEDLLNEIEAFKRLN